MATSLLTQAAHVDTVKDTPTLQPTTTAISYQGLYVFLKLAYIIYTKSDLETLHFFSEANQFIIVLFWDLFNHVFLNEL